ncbi:MAG TPA: hypothetical protein EYO59_13595, partial [Chromatiaceae bacterium]|nr:hypothetical protein [Chromatiaceae bacterium]
MVAEVSLGDCALLFSLFGVSFSLSLLVIWLGTQSVLRFTQIDQPCSRSLHSVSTQSGGGVGIILGCGVGAVILASLEPMSLPVDLLLIAGIGVALTGYIDDRRTLTGLTRLIVQIAVATTVVLAGLRLTEISLGDSGLDFPVWLASIITGLFIIWMINLYNFMDGMDGLSATMAIVGFGSLGWLGFIRGDVLFAGAAWVIS